MDRQPITQFLDQWMGQTGRKPLILRGARQVGKTFAVRSFGRERFEAVVELNFELRPDLKSIFESTVDPTVILRQLSLALGTPIQPGQTLLFLDEIQNCPRAITALRYFYENLPQLHVIAAGSLLEFALEAEEFSMPVGRVQPCYMYPLGFSEFLRACGESLFCDFIAAEVNLGTTIPDVLHQKGLGLVRQYATVGGMPEAVAAYLPGPETLTYRRAQTALLQTFRDDFAKYASTAQHKYLEKVFLTAPGMVATRYVYSRVDAETPSRELKQALLLLEKAGIIVRIRSTSGAGLPLEAQADDRRFKLAFLDLGLVQAALGLQAELALSCDFTAINSGALAEQFVAQELIAGGSQEEQQRLYYWERNARGSTAEVDFLYQYDRHILPLEVKAGSTGRLLSIRSFLEKYGAPLGVRISQHTLSFHDRILSVPFYLLPALRRLVAEAMNVKNS